VHSPAPPGVNQAEWTRCLARLFALEAAYDKRNTLPILTEADLSWRIRELELLAEVRHREWGAAPRV
jgi:hypothetical protein